MKEVSLYIPCFNAAKTIKFCLDAVIRQKYPVKEILVIDDGSTDESEKIVSTYPVKLFKHGANLGLAAARNTALHKLNTEFIGSLDADCLPEADWLQRIMAQFTSPRIAGVGGKLLEACQDNVFDFWRAVHMKQYWPSARTEPDFLFGSNVVFRKEAITGVGFYKEIYKSNYEDVDICRRLKDAGYGLIYEENALARHLKTDSILTLLNTYWKWNLGYYQKERFYRDQESFILKVKDNIGLANRYLEDDLEHKRYRLLYLDFLLAIHHSFRDFEHFINEDPGKNPGDCGFSDLSFWLSLLDLVFFYHFDSGKERLTSLLPRKNAFQQNFFALTLIMGKFFQGKFKNKLFGKILYKHLFLSLYKKNDIYLLDKLSVLSELDMDWGKSFRKKQPNLDPVFINNISHCFQEWTGELNLRFKDILELIEISQEETDSSKEEGIIYGKDK